MILRIRNRGLIILVTLWTLSACTYFDALDSSSESFNVPSKLPLVIGHRGAAGLAPENTLSAIQVAIDLGADAVEFDVQRTSDGELVIMHDNDVDRTTNGEGFVRNLTLVEIKSLDAGSWFSDDYTGEPVPTVRDVFNLVQDNDILLFIELKDPFLYTGIESEIVDLIAEYGYENRVYILSFYHRSLEIIRDLNPDLILSGLWSESPSEDGDGFDVVNARYTILTRPAEFINMYHVQGIEVIVWTVDDSEIMIRLIEAGIDGIITDYPDILLDILNS
jgi:glycerophosphoryl diester phosphodiesterase